jgi:hypothetical protein
MGTRSARCYSDVGDYIKTSPVRPSEIYSDVFLRVTGANTYRTQAPTLIEVLSERDFRLSEGVVATGRPKTFSDAS